MSQISKNLSIAYVNNTTRILDFSKIKLAPSDLDEYLEQNAHLSIIDVVPVSTESTNGYDSSHMSPSSLRFIHMLYPKTIVNGDLFKGKVTLASLLDHIKKTLHLSDAFDKLFNWEEIHIYHTDETAALTFTLSRVMYRVVLFIYFYYGDNCIKSTQLTFSPTMGGTETKATACVGEMVLDKYIENDYLSVITEQDILAYKYLDADIVSFNRMVSGALETLALVSQDSSWLSGPFRKIMQDEEIYDLLIATSCHPTKVNQFSQALTFKEGYWRPRIHILVKLKKNGLSFRGLETEVDWDDFANEYSKQIVKMHCKTLKLSPERTRWILDRLQFRENSGCVKTYSLTDDFKLFIEHPATMLTYLGVRGVTGAISKAKSKVDRNTDFLGDVLSIMLDGEGVTENALRIYDRYLSARNWYDGYTKATVFNEMHYIHHHSIGSLVLRILDTVKSSNISMEQHYRSEDAIFKEWLLMNHPDVSAYMFCDRFLGSIKDREFAVSIYAHYLEHKYNNPSYHEEFISEDEIRNSALSKLGDDWVIVTRPLELISWAGYFKNCSASYMDELDNQSGMILIYNGLEKPVMVYINYDYYRNDHDAGVWRSIHHIKPNEDFIFNQIGAIGEVKFPLNKDLSDDEFDKVMKSYFYAVDQYILEAYIDNILTADTSTYYGKPVDDPEEAMRIAIEKSPFRNLDVLERELRKHIKGYESLYLNNTTN